MDHEQYPHLANEIDSINSHYGTVGVLDALEHIQYHREEYRGTQCWREFRMFVAEMSKLFEPA